MLTADSGGRLAGAAASADSAGASASRAEIDVGAASSCKRCCRRAATPPPSAAKKLGSARQRSAVPGPSQANRGRGR